MVHLLCFPSEILLRICDFLDAYDVQSFSCCNKFIFELTEEKRHATISLSNLPRPRGRPCHPFLFLLKILLSPQFASHIKGITFGPWRYMKDLGSEDYYSEELLYDICTVLLSHQYLRENQIKDYHRLLRCFNCGSDFEWDLFAFMVLENLPNLQVVNICDQKFIPNPLRGLFKDFLFESKIARRYTPSKLSRLREVDLSYSSFPDYCRLPVELFTLPSLRFIRGTHIRIPGLLAQSSLMCRAEIEEIHFSSSHFDPDCLARFLVHAETLTSFTYEQVTDEEELWRPAKLLEGLRYCAWRSLTQLDLTIDSEMCLPMQVDLRGFKVLKTLRLSSYLLYHLRPPPMEDRGFDAKGRIICREDQPRSPTEEDGRILTDFHRDFYYSRSSRLFAVRDPLRRPTTMGTSMPSQAYNYSI